MFHEKFYQSDVSPKPAADAVNAGTPLVILDSLLSKGEGVSSFGFEWELYCGRLFAEVWWSFFPAALVAPLQDFTSGYCPADFSHPPPSSRLLKNKSVVFVVFSLSMVRFNPPFIPALSLVGGESPDRFNEIWREYHLANQDQEIQKTSIRIFDATPSMKYNQHG